MLKKLGVALSLVALYSSSAFAASRNPGLAGVEGTLRNVESALNKAVNDAERLFEENHGVAMSSEFLFPTHIAPHNEYISYLGFTRTYGVRLQFRAGGGPRPAFQTTRYNSPVARGLLGAVIRLIPVYNPGDEKITSWECVTNADKNVAEFMGDTPKNLSASFIREHTKNQYLSLCTYIDTAL